MTTPVRLTTLPTEADAPRKVLHAIVALAGWVVFAYWWWLVFRRVAPQEVRFTTLFVLIAAVAAVLITLIWARHNLRLSARKEPRTQVREIAPDFSRDRLGRAISFEAVPEQVNAAPVVYVRVSVGGKAYEAATRVVPMLGYGPSRPTTERHSPAPPPTGGETP